MDPISKYIILALGILLLVSGTGTYYFYNHYQDEVKNVVTLKDQVEEFVRNQAQKDADIKLCNSRVDEFVKASKLLEDKGKEAQKQASVEAKKKDIVIQDLLRDKQKPGEDSCVAAKRLLDKFITERKANEVPNPSY